MERSYQSLMSTLADNNTGRIGPVDIRSVVDSVRDSALVETFGFSSPLSVPLSTWTALGGNGTPTALAAGPGANVPAWLPLRTSIIAGAGLTQRYSRVGGLFGLASDGLGYVYKSPAADPASLISGPPSRMISVAVGLNGTVVTSDAAMALVFYRTKLGGALASATTTRECVFPIDTGAGTSPYLFTLGGVDQMILDPGDVLRYRLEYYRNSDAHPGGPFVSPLSITAVTIKQFTIHLSTMGVIEPAADCEVNVTYPDATGYTGIVWKADGLDEAARSIY